MMPTIRDDLNDFISEGLVADIFIMERSYNLLVTIGKNAVLLNQKHGSNFGIFFGTIQDSLKTSAILAASHLYDSSSNRYPTRCIPRVLDFLETNCEKLPTIEQVRIVQADLRRLGFSDTDIDLVSSDGPAFAKALVSHFKEILKHEKTDEAITALKNIRDKAIAHNEQSTEIVGPTWEKLLGLIEIAKNFVGILGWAYLNTAYVHNGKHVLSEDAEIPTRALKRLIESVYGSGQVV